MYREVMTPRDALDWILMRALRIGPLHFYWARREARLRISVAWAPGNYYMMTPEQKAAAGFTQKSEKEVEWLMRQP